METNTTTTSTSESMDTNKVLPVQVARNDQYINTYYDIANKLDANPSFPDDDKLYAQIIEYSSKTKQTKKISPQFISKYFKRFPTYQEKAIDCLIDLFDSSDEDVVRINALKAIPTICRDNPDHIAKLVDILGQLLNTDSKIEAEHAKNSLIELYKLNSLTTINSLLTFLESEDASGNNNNSMNSSTNTTTTGDQSLNSTFTTLLSFLKDSLIPLIRTEYSKSTLETQTFFRDRILKLVAKSVIVIELDVLFQLLDCFPQYKPLESITTIDTLVVPVIENQPLPVLLKKLLYITKMLLFKSKKQNLQIDSKIFQLHLTKVLPKYNELEDSKKSEYISVLAQSFQHMTQEMAGQFLEPIFTLFKLTVPSKTTTPVNDVDLDFTIVEALLFSLSYIGSSGSSNALCKLCGFKIITGQPSDMNSDPIKHEDLLGRLRFLDEKCRETQLKAKKAIPHLGSPKDSSQLKLAQKIILSTQNILTIMQNFLKSPPQFNISMLVISSTIFHLNQLIKQPKQPNQQQQTHINPNQLHKLQQQQHHQQQQNIPIQRNQHNKSNRFSPYGNAGKRFANNRQDLDQPMEGNNNNTNNSRVEIHYNSEKHNKPQSFKGRGPRNF